MPGNRNARDISRKFRALIEALAQHLPKRALDDPSSRASRRHFGLHAPHESSQRVSTATAV
jgi:hypothetical protein